MVTTGDRWISDARLFAEVTRAKCGGPIHVIGGSQEARVTIYSQQCRAINLVCALRELDPRLTEKSIAVIGAGASGMTAASALHAIGVPDEKLTIYERAASPIYVQRWSYSRFLHPRLFHWPEPGWKDGRASLPLADWRAGYAATVREQILSQCAALPIKFCTDVRCVKRDDLRAEVTIRPLHSTCTETKTFDIVLVACGFATEPKVADTIGGTYWHGLDGLNDLTGDVHVVGDGDSALTEVLMMLIDRFGHGVIEQLCQALRLTHADRLHSADLEAQGNPSKQAEVRPEDAELPAIMTLFQWLSRARQRSVLIHAEHALSGTSFLLNRALVSHLTWGPEPMVHLKRHTIDPLKVQSELGPGANVIWRAGVGESQSKPLAEARMTTKGLIASLTPTNVIAPFDAGLLTGLLDGLRRPMWTASARRILAAGVPDGGAGWTQQHVTALYPVFGRPTSEAKELLAVLAATEAHLKRIGLPEIDALRFGEARWVSIDVLARAGSCPHTDLVHPSPPRVTQWDLTKSGQITPVPPAPLGALRCDEQDRLWFRMPAEPADVCPTRSAVCAIVTPSILLEWVHREPTRGGLMPRQRGRRRFASEVSSEVLRGLGDVAGADVRTRLLLAAIHQEREEWVATRSAYMRAGRKPGGERVDATKRQERATPHVNVAFRRVLLGLGVAISRMRPGEPDAAEHAIWLMLAAAGANLVTLTSSDALILELGTTPAFLSNIWAPRVRMVLTPPGRRTPDLQRAAPPDWVRALAGAAIELRGTERTSAQPRFDSIRALAGAAAGYAEAETPSEPLITLSELGVWAAGTDMDQELRNSFSSAAQEPPAAI
jgi:hypothetical protein